MDGLLAEDLWKNVVVYLDDIIIYTKSKHEHEVILQKIKAKLKTAGLILNTEKCEFVKSKIEILGHIIEDSKISPTASRIKAIKDFKHRKSKKDLQSFLGLTNYCRKFIPSPSTLAKPLYLLLQKCIAPIKFEVKINSKEAKSTIDIIKTAITGFSRK
ncbi:hypothetical protein ENBRE01_3164 [Enteropsectra breve]|nr:hypothetical protein ENBRE01_3164 [Enteropsectra breve]